MTWQSSLPRVSKIAATPIFVIPMKACGARAARIASAATWMLPSVPFLKPTGQLRPEASWRWLWLSVVRAPMAPQATSSAANGIGPGYVLTDQVRWLFDQPDYAQKILSKQPTGRIANLSDLDGAVLFLATAASDYVTGQMIIVDGASASGWVGPE